MADTPLVAYDPEREGLVQIAPAEQKSVEALGWKVGPDAQAEAVYHEPAAKAAAAFGSAANALTFGLSDIAVEKTLSPAMLKTYHESRRANPQYELGGEAASLPLKIAEVAALPEALVGQAVMGGVEGAANYYATAKRLNHPLEIDRLFMAMGVGAAMYALPGAAIKGAKAGLGLLSKAAKGMAGAGTAAVEEGVQAAADVMPQAQGSFTADVTPLWGPIATPPAAPLQAPQLLKDVASVASPRLKNAIDLMERLPQMSPEAAAKLSGRAGAAARLIQRAGEQFVKQGGNLLKTLVPVGIQRAEETNPPFTHENIDKEYAEKSEIVGKINASPEQFAQSLYETYGSAFDHSSEMRAAFDSLVARHLMAAQVLQDHMPVAPYAPGIKARTFDPPRSAKIQWLHAFHAAESPLEALKNPSPMQVRVMEDVTPDTLNHVRQNIVGALTNPKVKLTSQQARRLSVILGTPVSPETDGKFIDRLQKSAVPDAPQSAPKPNAAPSGPNNLATMTAPVSMQNALGQ